MQKQRRATIRSVFYAFALFSGSVLLVFWLTSPHREGSSNLEIGTKNHAERMNQKPDPEIAEKAQVALEGLQYSLEELEGTNEGLPEYENPDDTQGFALAEGAAEVVEVEEQETSLRERLAALEEQQGDERLEAVNQLWYFAADHGVPEEALEKIYELTLDPDPEIAEKAQFALEDLQNLLDDSDDEQDKYGIERGAALVMDALDESDDDQRADAMGAVALRRDEDAQAALMDGAIFDSVPEIRYQALQALWYTAADGLDTDGHIKATLEEAVSDPDPDVSALAKRALEDLETLE